MGEEREDRPQQVISYRAGSEMDGLEFREEEVEMKNWKAAVSLPSFLLTFPEVSLGMPASIGGSVKGMAWERKIGGDLHNTLD